MNDILKPHGTATVVLFCAQFDSQLPTIGKLKRALGTDHIKIYKSNGNHAYVVRQIERLLNHKRKFGNANQPNAESTHLIILPLGHYEKLFASIAFSALLVGGFNLNSAALDELESIDKRRWSVDQIAETAKDVRRKLEWSKEAADRVGIDDPSIQAAIDYHDANFDPNYGQTIAQAYQQQQQEWFNQHSWRDRRDAQEDGTDTDVQLAA